MLPPTAPSGEDALEAELLRNVLATIAHDLGSLSGALALRADVMPHVALAASASACTAIASELHTLGGQIREMSGPRGDDTLAPTRAGSLEHWFDLLSRFAQPLLGRGVSFRGDVLPLSVGAVAVHELTYIVLAILHAIRERETLEHTDIFIASEPTDQAVTILILLRHAGQTLGLADVAGSRWSRWALQRAASARIGLRIEDARVELLVPLTNPRVVAVPVPQG